VKRVLAVLLLAASCASPPRARIDVSIAPSDRELDLLFVIDDSSSMGDKQDAFAAAFPQFFDSLAQLRGGMLDLHIGVVSSDVGVGGFPINGCEGNGDDGRLQAVPHGMCQPPSGYFIVHGQSTNYSDSLPATLACIARLGEVGCGFEQHLEAAKRALDGHAPQNAGFLRDSATLGIIILADEDDCSAKDTSLFDPANAALGPLRGHVRRLHLESRRVLSAGSAGVRRLLPRLEAGRSQQGDRVGDRWQPDTVPRLARRGRSSCARSVVR
jgi:hypothetical protein